MPSQKVLWPNLSEWIAYTSNRSGTFDLWLYRPIDGLHFPITQGLGEQFSAPYWSPDGLKIAFVGKRNVIYVLDRHIGRAAQIDQVEPYTLLDWSPDNRLLSYVKNDRIVIYDVFSHNSYSIIEQGASDVQWFPSGRELLFAAPDSAGIGQLYRINVDGTNKRQLTRNTFGPLHQIRLSPDGSFALFTSPGASISIITAVDLTTGTAYSLEGGPLAKNYFPDWSPDSRQIAYSATDFAESQYYSLIQTESRTGHNKTMWAISNCFSTPVSWSPDGSRIAYLSGCENLEAANEIWVVNLQNPVPVKIVEGGYISALQWSPPMTASGFEIYDNREFHVSFPYPSTWHKTAEERYEGPDGFFQISAISSEGRIDEVCRSEAFHILKPYGSKPEIIPTHIRGQEACFIIPSADQPVEMNHQAALIVRYPQPVQIRGASYNYFVLWSNQQFIIPLSQGLTFI